MAQRFSKRQSNSYLIENIDFWTPQGVQHDVQILVENGRVKAIGKGLSGANTRIDGMGKVVMPAGVDAQTHLRVPGQAHKELPETGLLAALRGGYSAVLTMPNTQPTIDSPEVLKMGQAAVEPFEREFGVKVFWSAAITKSLNSDDPTNFVQLAEAGVRAFTNDGLGVLSDAVMEEAFRTLEKLNIPLLQHAEFLGHGGALAPGPVQEKVKAAPYPDDPEWKMVERDIRELKKYPGARYHVLHVSSRKTLDLVKQAKKEGLCITAEVTPHHLYFNTETLDPNNKSFKMNPPIRSQEDQQSLWKGLGNGAIDFVSTDHAPHEATMKSGGFDSVAFGTIGLETTLPVLFDGWKKGLLSPERLVEVFASKPAEFLNLPDGFGEIKEGLPFHAVWVNPSGSPHVYAEKDFSSLSKNSCFVGAQLPGRILGAFHEQSIFQFE